MTDPDDPTPDDLIEPADSDTLARILWFMEQARKRQFRVGPFLRVGNVTLQVADLRQSQPPPTDDGPSIWQLAGHQGDE